MTDFKDIRPADAGKAGSGSGLDFSVLDEAERTAAAPASVSRLPSRQPRAPSGMPDAGARPAMAYDMRSAAALSAGQEARGPKLQITVQGPAETILSFKRLCLEERRSYHEMLDILMKERSARLSGRQAAP